MNKLFVFTDGGSRGNPGPAAIGIVIKTETGQILAKISRKIGEGTNNVAEYMAVIAALEWLKINNPIIQSSLPAQATSDVAQAGNNPIVQFFLDSKLVVNQLNGFFKVKDSDLRNLLLKVRLLEQDVGGQIICNYIPREKNWEADALVNQALDN